MRDYIRHPSGIPIDFQPEGTPEKVLLEAHSNQLKNISQGGLAFHSPERLSPGTLLRVKIPVVIPVFQAVGRVTWCHDLGDCFEVGVAFLDQDDVFRARMVEQICHIEHYRQQVLKQDGRTLDSEQAAEEWIDRFAPNFPGTDE